MRGRTPDIRKEGKTTRRDAYFPEPRKILENSSDQDKEREPQSQTMGARTATKWPCGKVRGSHLRAPCNSPPDAPSPIS